MKIVHIGTNTTGGAGLGMLQLHKALLARGVDSRIITTKINPEESGDPRISLISMDDADLVGEVDEFADKVGAMVEAIRKRDRNPISSPYSKLRLERHAFVKEADIVHLHWVSNMIDVPSFFSEIDKPVVWTIRDENPMMGFYHIRRDQPINAVREEKIMDDYVRELKTSSIKKCKDLTFVSLCNGIKEVTSKSQIGEGRPVVVIPNAIDGNTFFPNKREETRADYAIAPDETVLLFIAQALSMKHKGLPDLFHALSLVDRTNRKFTLICIGNGKVPEGVPSGVRVIAAGFVSSQDKLSRLYSAADVMVSPSFSETFGKTMAEALACGTPVVSYPNHGAKDLVREGVDGCIADAFNPYAFARALEKCLSLNFDADVLHESTYNRFRPESISEAHFSLYQKILSRSLEVSPIEERPQATEDVIATAKRIKLSIITICYNNVDGLRQTLRSTLTDQPSFDDFEQIVVDGGSTDGTVDIINEYKDRLSWWCSEKDAGIYNAMNKGAMHARGEYLLFLNSGDILKTDMLAEVFREPFNEDLVYADIYTFTKKGIAFSHAADVEELTPGWFLYNTMPHQAMLIRKTLHDKLGGYDETMKISAAPKFAFQSVIEQKCSVRKLNCVFSVYDCSGISSQPRYMHAKFKERERFLVPYFGRRVSACAWQWSLSRLLLDPDMLVMIGKKTEIAPSLKEHIRECIVNPALFQKQEPAKPISPKPKQEPVKSISPKPAAAVSAKSPAQGTSKNTLQTRELQDRLKRAELEFEGIKTSTAYRTGMFITWPLRKVYRFFRPFNRKKSK